MMRGSAGQACKSRYVSAVLLQKALGDAEVPSPPEVLGVGENPMLLTSRCSTHWASVTWPSFMGICVQILFTRTVTIMDEVPPPSRMTSFNLNTSAENFCPRTLPASQQAVIVLL